MTNYFINKLYEYLTDDSSINNSKIIKLHTKQINSADLSFPLNIKSWYSYIKDRSDKILKSLEDTKKKPEIFIHELIQNSEKWPLSIQTIALTTDHCFITLKRDTAFKYTIQDVLTKNHNYGYDTSNPLKSVYVYSSPKEPTESLTDLRIEIATAVCKNFLIKLGYEIRETRDDCDLNLCIVRHIMKKEESVEYILCGVVTTADKSEYLMKPNDFKEKRTLQMQLLAQHKYGMRFTNSVEATTLCKQLGDSSVKFELLQVKLSKPLTINLHNHASCSSKGISFILYNYARILSMCDTFDKRESEGVYTKLPNFDQIDCSLLNNDMEWEILFCYILRFPKVVNDCIKDINNGLFNPHYLCNFLSGLVSVFSVYYKNVKILVTSHSHLTSVTHARIYLIKAINYVIKNGLALLDIPPVKRM